MNKNINKLRGPGYMYVTTVKSIKYVMNGLYLIDK